MKHKNKMIVGISVVALFLVVAIGVTYSLWSKTFTQSGENRLVSDCFSLTFEEVKGTSIQLENAFPMTDKEGSRLKPYQFKVKNNCDAYAKYSVLLDVPKNVSLKDEYLKIKLDQNQPNLLRSYSLDELNKDENKDVYILDSWYLKFQEEREYSFLVWLDENVTQDMEGVQNATWSGKIRISASYASEGYMDPGTLRKISSSDMDGMWGYKENISKIIIQNKLEPIENAEASYDESILQDGSVMSYVVANGDGSYTGYLQSNRELYLNSGVNLFKNFKNTTDIEGMEYINTSNVTNMAYMFNGMINLMRLDVSHFDTSKVTNMGAMFQFMRNLKSLDISNFDTSNVKNMSLMFWEVQKLATLDLSHFDTSKVTNMAGIFHQMASLSNLNISNFNTSNVTDMNQMFDGMTNLTNLDISNFDTSKVTNMSHIFYDIPNIASLDLSHFNTSNVKNMNNMFSRMKNLTYLDVSSFDTTNVTNMDGMFNELSQLRELNLRSFNTRQVTNMANMFSGMENLENLDVSNFDTSNVTTMWGMFSNCKSLTRLDLSHFHTDNVEYLVNTFFNMSNLEYLDISNFDTHKVVDYFGMFNGDSKLTTIVYGNNFVYANDAKLDVIFDQCPANKPTHESWSGKL